MSRNDWRHPTLGAFEWEPDVEAWVRRVEVVLGGRREEVTLELSGYRRRQVEADQADLAERLVRGLLTERWPEVLQRSAAHGGSAWDLESKRDRTRIQVDDGHRWHVTVHLNEDVEPEFDDRDDTSLRFDFSETRSAPTRRPLTTSVAALAALERVLAAAALRHDLDGPLEELASRVSARYTPPRARVPAAPPISPKVEAARRLLADWHRRGRVEFGEGANLEAVAAWFLAHVGGRQDPRIGDWLVGLDEVAEVYATDEELMADLARATFRPLVDPPAPAEPPAPDADPDQLAGLLAPLDPRLRDGIRRVLEVLDDDSLDAALDDLAGLLRLVDRRGPSPIKARELAALEQALGAARQDRSRRLLDLSCETAMRYGPSELPHRVAQLEQVFRRLLGAWTEAGQVELEPTEPLPRVARTLALLYAGYTRPLGRMVAQMDEFATVTASDAELQRDLDAAAAEPLPDADPDADPERLRAVLAGLGAETRAAFEKLVAVRGDDDMEVAMDALAAALARGEATTG